MSMRILIFNNGVVCRSGMSGSDRRAIHWADIFAEKHNVSVVIPGFAKERFKSVPTHFHTVQKEKPVGLFNYLWRTLLGIMLVIRIRADAYDVVYSTSDLLPDAIPALVMRWLSPRTRWITGLHLIAPSPFHGYRQAYQGKFSFPSIKTIYYHLTQSMITFFMQQFAFLVFVSNENDKRHLLGRNFIENQVLVTYGAPEWEQIQTVKKNSPEYDVCFIARFHPQKGYDDLLKAWRVVINYKTNARLAIIGDIPEIILHEKMTGYGIQPDSITYHGFLDGIEKYTVLSKSKMLAFPSLYESFGMVAAEAQACGVPVVAYKLPFYKTVYPKGMAQVPIGDIDAFAEQIIYLITHESERQKLANDAYENATRFDFRQTGYEILRRLEG